MSVAMEDLRLYPADYIENLERIVRTLATENLDADAADAVTVLDVLVKEAQQTLRRDA